MASLSRQMTAVEFMAWLDASPKLKLRELAGIGLRDGVDADTLIGAIETEMKPSPAALVHYFENGAATGHLGALAQTILVFVKNEVAAAEAQARNLKRQRSTEKCAKLAVAIEKEKKARVSNDAAQLAFTARQAGAETAVPSWQAAQRATFEKHGLTMEVNVSMPAQQHMQYYLDNVVASVALLDGKLENGECEPARVMSKVFGQKKSKKGGTKPTHQHKIHVPGSFLKEIFREREAVGADLRLTATEGPFSQPYFIGLVSKKKKDDEKKDVKRCAKVDPAQLEEERDAEVEHITTKHAKLVASANLVLSKRNGDLELVCSPLRT